MEIKYLIISSVLVLLAGICNAVMDNLKFHWYKSVFSTLSNTRWYEPESWKNKYKNRDIEQGEAFCGSTTIFVFVTDAWHFFQMLWRLFLTGAVVVSSFVGVEFSIIWMVGLFTLYSLLYLGAFNSFYDNILNTD